MLMSGLPIFHLWEEGIMDRQKPSEIELSEDERQIYERLGPLFEQERLRMARALASGPLFGKKEFELRDRVQRLRCPP